MQIKHGIKLYKGSTSFVIPEKFEEFIDETIERWNIQINDHILMFSTQPYAVFSIGYDIENQVQAITIQNPSDFFNEEILQNILSGRIDKMLGRKKTVYKTLPKFISTPRNCKNCRHWKELRKDFRTCVTVKSILYGKITKPHYLCEEYNGDKK